MLERIRQGVAHDLRTTVVAVVAASVVAGPAAAAAIVVNADKVDNRHAVGAAASQEKRAGKLVATNRRGFLPRNIIVKARNSDTVDGINSVDLLPGGTLPSGTTIRGTYGVFGRGVRGAYVPAGDDISYGYRLTEAPTARIVRVGGSAVEGCPGTAADPAAQAGYLCVYEADSQGMWPGMPTMWSSTHVGAVVRGYSNGEDVNFISTGSWAVTAP